MRFLRLSYIVPRLVLLAMLLLATEIGSGYMLRYLIATIGQSVVGAKVDVGPVKASLLETRLLVRDLAVANPNAPMSNLLEAERVEIDFDSSALLRKKLIAEYGVVSGLEFGAHRETSGELPTAVAELSSDAEPGWIQPAASDLAGKWIDDLQHRISGDLESQFESVRLAEGLVERWPIKYAEIEARAAALKQEAKQLEQTVRTAKQNPLRNVELLASVPQRVANLRTSLAALQKDLQALPDQLAADRAAITEARTHDEQLVRQQLDQGALDAQSLTNYLLGEQIAEPIGETIAWVRWARGFVPSRRPARMVEPANRGQNIFFPGSQQQPNMLVKAVRLDGSAQLGGQTVELVGVVRDWTNQPQLHAKPTTLEMTTKGGLPLKVNVSLDRTKNVARDRMFCTTSDLLLPAARLGRDGKLQLSIEPTRADLTFALDLVDDELNGSLDIVQRGVQLTPSLGSGKVAARLETAIAQNLSKVNGARTAVAITGTLDAPRLEARSTLGNVVAQAIGRAANDVVVAERQRLLAQAQQLVDGRIAMMTSQLNDLTGKVAADLTAPGEILAGLSGQGGAATEIGRSPFGQLFK